jgi:hypothetical protein
MTAATDAMDVALSEAPILDPEGRPVPLSSLWREGTVVVSFVRHFG